MPPKWRRWASGRCGCTSAGPCCVARLQPGRAGCRAARGEGRAPRRRRSTTAEPWRFSHVAVRLADAVTPVVVLCRHQFLAAARHLQGGGGNAAKPQRLSVRPPAYVWPGGVGTAAAAAGPGSRSRSSSGGAGTAWSAGAVSNNRAQRRCPPPLPLSLACSNLAQHRGALLAAGAPLDGHPARARRLAGQLLLILSRRQLVRRQLVGVERILAGRPLDVGCACASCRCRGHRRRHTAGTGAVGRREPSCGGRAGAALRAFASLLLAPASVCEGA